MPRDSQRLPLAERTTYLYCTFGTQSELIYVGISQDWLARLRMHERDSSWWPHVDHYEVSVFQNRADAFAAESWIIAHAEPLMNSERQEKRCPQSMPEPITSFSRKVTRWSLSGDREIPTEAVTNAMVQG